MFKRRWLVALFVTCLFISLGAVHGQDHGEQTLHIDVPVKLEKGNVVFDVGHAVFIGDMLFVLGDLNLIANDYAEWNTKGQIIAVFHGDVAYIVLNDDTYNTTRHVKTGNPYAKLVTGLMNRGVQIEMCGATAQANNWVNANLLPGIKVDTNAMVRITQLEQQGFTLIYE